MDMESTTTSAATADACTTTSASTAAVATATRRTHERLLFDRRYGWVYDEWKEPSEEALAGGRGMFCILPLAKSLINMASQSINLATSSAVNILERPEEFSPQALQANLNNQLKKFMSSIKQPNLNLFTKPSAHSSMISSSGLEHHTQDTGDSGNG